MSGVGGGGGGGENGKTIWQAELGLFLMLTVRDTNPRCSNLEDRMTRAVVLI